MSNFTIILTLFKGSFFTNKFQTKTCFDKKKNNRGVIATLTCKNNATYVSCEYYLFRKKLYTNGRLVQVSQINNQVYGLLQISQWCIYVI